jgi:MFS family permease
VIVCYPFPAAEQARKANETRSTSNICSVFGRRWFFIGSSIMALFGNIIGASAQSVNQLIATNCLNGLAAAGQLSFSVIIGELVPNKLRGPFNALVLSTSVPFAVFGPPVARAFFENTGLQWRWSYILGCIINFIAAAMYFLCYHPPTYEQLHIGGKSRLKQLKGLDWIGIFLFSAGLVLFLIGLNCEYLMFLTYLFSVENGQKTNWYRGWPNISLEIRANSLYTSLWHCYSRGFRMLGGIQWARLPTHSYATFQEHQI